VRCPEENKEQDDGIRKTMERIKEDARVRGTRVRDRVTF
jgi:hypothetical protein